MAPLGPLSHAHLLLALSLAASSPRRAGATACAGATYSYGSGACSSCPAGATFVSAAAGCAPAAAPADAAFYLSGSAAEGVAAWPTVAVPAGVSYTAGPFGAAASALAPGALR